MSKWIRESLNKDEGFTLVELMVVVLIIAILIAIAIPTFLGARERAQDRAAQSNLRNALTAAKVFYTDGEQFPTNDAAGAALLQAIEPSMVFVAGNAPDGTATPPEDVGMLVEANADGDALQSVVFVAESRSGTWFCIADQATGSAAGTYYNSDTSGAATAAAIDTALVAGECDGAEW
jgi:type IV pilus assembly protein PilA